MKKIKEYFKNLIDQWGQKHLLKEWSMNSCFFLPPKPEIYFGRECLGLGCGRYDWKKDWWKIIRFRNWDVSWKDKENDPRYEFPPQINIILFNRWQFLVRWFAPGGSSICRDDIYWETMLDYSHYKKSLFESIKANTWEGYAEHAGERYNAYSEGFLTEYGNLMYENSQKSEK